MSLRWRLRTVRPRRVLASATFLAWGTGIACLNAAYAIGGLFRDILEDWRDG